ncbi:ATP-dependent DNA helicase [Quillaja saponaria]|uniref:DNA 3'-5' helicase n=1 Tax=Quillaja saponaria TaxID=32244 RepID=A0AAD7QCW5_QUISA|nr:ATP-dependent DNA helicase [Quillaja saponaria]
MRHIASQHWGHDFRPSYRKLSSLRGRLPDVPILALTATAVPKVQKDVIESLHLQNPLVLKSSFNRPNIYYEVRYKDLLDDAYDDLYNLLKSSGDVCAIVYCLERSTCDGLSAHLSRNGISSAAYHAGLNNKLRSSVLDDWISSNIQVVVATVAFGYGIDRKDVRIVCHLNIPKSMEAFYQESGRAGRDQLPSKSVLYYGMDDRKKMEFILRNSGSKKRESTSSQEESSRRWLNTVKDQDAEGKKFLRVLGSRKTCDACRHPNLVAKYLEELTTTCALRQKNNSSRVFISSSTDGIDEQEVSEFWNHDDEASCSDEDISDSDDGSEFVKSLSGSKFQPELGLNAKIAFLQRAEEKYYQNENADKQTNKVDKNAISETMREASRQRLQSSLKQAQQRLDNLSIEVVKSASSLEDDCFRKYGKTGKSFYYSQVASTVRWLSTTNSYELINRIGATATSPSGNFSSEAEHSHPQTLFPSLDPGSGENTSSELQGSTTLETSLCGLPVESASLNMKLSPIPSFSDFVNSRKLKDNRSTTSQKLPPSKVEKNLDKRMRLQ